MEEISFCPFVVLLAQNLMGSHLGDLEDLLSFADSDYFSPFSHLFGSASVQIAAVNGRYR